MSHQPGSSLTETLVLALTQCQEQLKIIQQHAARIDRLQQENERLARELQDYRKVATQGSQKDADRTQELFQKYAEAQAEVKVLKSKLKSHKAKASQRLPLPLSSPASTPVTSVPSSPRPSSTKRKDPEESSSPMRCHGERKQDQEEYERHSRNSDALEFSPPRKRTRSHHLERARTFKVGPSLAQATPSFTSTSGSDFVERKIAAISYLAEDGEENTPESKHQVENGSVLDQSKSLHHRLEGLLAGSFSSKNRLAKPPSRSLQLANTPSTPQPRTPSQISNIQHVYGDNELSMGRPTNRTPLMEPDFAESQIPSDGFEAPASCGTPPFGSKRPAYTENPINQLRTQPVIELQLSSFKPNPRWLSSHNISFDDFLKDRQHERMRTLAATLPRLPGETHGHHFTDDELLIDFLGPGSENKIANLTPVARQNLVIEARTKCVANEFRLFKPTATTDDHQDDPPGFWSTDMPGTQEAEENRSASRQKEREEVKRRYNDAISGQGKWIFADE